MAQIEAESASAPEATRLRDLTPAQWRAGLAAWLGWAFDGLDAYLYILVALPFVSELLGPSAAADRQSVGKYASWIQAVFLLGWALGGVVFGRLGDRLGRCRTLGLTILTYAVFTGLSALAQTWWHLLIFRFLTALGIGGEWAAGSALVAETWPKRWRPWISAVLQTAYTCGMLLATLALYLLPASPRAVFLVGALPALAVFWIRRAVDEPAEWYAARASARQQGPRLADLFRGEVRHNTIMTILLCSLALSITWAFQFWSPAQLRRLPDVAVWSPREIEQFISQATALLISTAIVGNFFAAWLAKVRGYRQAFAIMFLGGFIVTVGAYAVPRDHRTLLAWTAWTSFFTGGVFGLFPLYLPPLFPTLLRTTGSGFCYNIGRVAAAIGTVVSGKIATMGSDPVTSYRIALQCVGWLCLPAVLVSLVIPVPTDQKAPE